MTIAKARAGMVVAATALGALTLAPVWRGNASDAGRIDPGTADGSAPSPMGVAATGKKRAPSIASGATIGAPSVVGAGRLSPPLVAGAATVGAPSPAVYPPSALPVNFDHALHARRGIDCVRCHAEAARSVAAKDNLLPGEAACRPCHAIDRAQPLKEVAPGQPAVRCDACHQNYSGSAGPGMPTPEPPRVMLQTAALKFNHKLHVDRQMACGFCHSGVDRVALATTAELPKMALCLGCHDGRQAAARCSACHTTLADGRLRTTFASGILIPSGSLRGIDAHTSGFRTDHKIAGRDERYCATCHKQSECMECHGAGTVRPSDMHPVDYATLHAIDARRNVPNCSSCHRNQSFCLGCHQRLGVAADPEGGQPGRPLNNPFGTGTMVKRFHPPGWSRDDTGAVLTAPTSASHSFQAKRNLRACVSCHREESCLACHSADPTRSMRVSPHNPGFLGSSACRAMAARNVRACLKCHAPGASALSCD